MFSRPVSEPIPFLRASKRDWFSVIASGALPAERVPTGRGPTSRPPADPGFSGRTGERTGVLPHRDPRVGGPQTNYGTKEMT